MFDRLSSESVILLSTAVLFAKLEGGVDYLHSNMAKFQWETIGSLAATTFIAVAEEPSDNFGLLPKFSRIDLQW